MSDTEHTPTKPPNFKRVESFLKKALQKAIEDTAVETQKLSREVAPYDTGTLRDSIQVNKVDKLTFQISANTDYAFYVHEGHATRDDGYVPGRAYLTVPLKQELEKFPARIKELIDAAMSRRVDES